MTCPKCGALMRPIQRNGVTLDRCVECAGVFLDRGELEHIVEAEHRFYATAGRDDNPRGGRGFRDDDDDYFDDDDDDYRRGRKKKSRKRSLFEDLFDID